MWQTNSFIFLNKLLWKSYSSHEFLYLIQIQIKKVRLYYFVFYLITVCTSVEGKNNDFKSNFVKTVMQTVLFWNFSNTKKAIKYHYFEVFLFPTQFLRYIKKIFLLPIHQKPRFWKTSLQIPLNCLRSSERNLPMQAQTTVRLPQTQTRKQRNCRQCSDDESPETF